MKVQEFSTYIEDSRVSNPELFECSCNDPKNKASKNACISCTSEQLLLSQTSTIIRSETIVWLLELLLKLSKTKGQSNLCCISSLTLLSIIDNN